LILSFTYEIIPFTMNIKTFLNETNQSINTFASKNGLAATTLWRACKNRPVRPCNASQIEKATGGAVTLRELLFPENKGS
jgi:hypothetical protein